MRLDATVPVVSRFDASGKHAAGDAGYDVEIPPTLIADIYAAALDPALWPAVLGQVARFVGGPFATLFSKDAVRKDGNVYYDDGAIARQYVQLHADQHAKLDPCMAAHAFGEIDQPVFGVDLVPLDRLHHTRTWKEWAKSQGLVDLTVVVLDKTATSIAMLGVFRQGEQWPCRRRSEDAHASDRAPRAARRADRTHGGPRGDRSGRIRRCVRRHRRRQFPGRCEHAHCTRQRGRARDARRRRSAARAERVARSGRSGGRSRATRDFRRGRIGRCRFGRQRCCRSARLAQRRALRRTFSAAGGGRTAQGWGRLHGSRRAVRPTRNARRAGCARGDRQGVSATPTELRVLLGIVQVGGAPEVADALGIGEATVKFHLKRLFAKTGARRQADLVKLVAGFVSPLT